MTDLSRGDSNGHSEPCWFRSDCQLATDQREGNKTLGLILDEIKIMNTSLVGPATNINRVPMRVFVLVVLVLASWGILEHLANAHQSFSGAIGNANWQIESQKKTSDNAK